MIYNIKLYNLKKYKDILKKYKNHHWKYKYIITLKSHDTRYIHKINDQYKKINIKKLSNDKIINFNKLSKFKYINEDIIDKYPDKPWDWEWLIENTNIKVEKYVSLDLIEKYSYKWNYSFLSYNKNITEEFILKYPYQDWNIEYLIKNNKITDFKTLSKFKILHSNNIKNYRDKPWDWKWLTKNTYISIDMCTTSLKLIKKCSSLNFYNLCYNPNLTKKFILKYPYKNWNIEYLIKNNKITDFNALTKFKNINNYIIDKYSNNLWDWEWLIENTNIRVEKYISLDLIEKYSYKWNYSFLSYNKNITKEFILKYPYQKWNLGYLLKTNKITDFKALSRFRYLDFGIIYDYPNKPWDWEWIYKNTYIKIEYYISLELIEKYIDKLNYNSLSCNKNITEEFILKYPNKNWDIGYLIRIDKITDFNALSKFKNINQNIIDIYSEKLWDWEWILENTNLNVEKYISLNLIEKYLYKLNYKKLKNNKNITKKFQKKFFYKFI